MLGLFQLSSDNIVSASRRRRRRRLFALFPYCLTPIVLIRDNGQIRQNDDNDHDHDKNTGKKVQKPYKNFEYQNYNYIAQVV